LEFFFPRTILYPDSHARTQGALSKLEPLLPLADQYGAISLAKKLVNFSVRRLVLLLICHVTHKTCGTQGTMRLHQVSAQSIVNAFIKVLAFTVLLCFHTLGITSPNDQPFNCPKMSLAGKNRKYCACLFLKHKIGFQLLFYLLMNPKHEGARLFKVQLYLFSSKKKFWLANMEYHKNTRVTAIK
jgi:hypothetical protein